MGLGLGAKFYLSFLLTNSLYSSSLSLYYSFYYYLIYTNLFIYFSLYAHARFARAEPWLNVLSEEPNKISRFEITRMQAKTEQTIEALRA